MALGAGLVLGYKKSETFRDIVNGAFSGIKAVVGPVLNWFKSAVGTAINFVRDHWRLIITIIGGPVGLAVALVTKHWNTIKSATTTAWNTIKSAISVPINAAKAVVGVAIDGIRGYFNLIGAIVGKVREWFGNIFSAVKEKLGDAVTFVKGFPGKITNALGDLGSLLYEKGKAIIQGLIEGIKSMAGSVGGAIKGILPDIPGVDLGGILGRASGGSINAGQTYLVGERGPELFTSSRAGYIVPNHQLSRVSGRGSSADTALLEKISTQLDALNRTTGMQGRNFGRELNGVAGNAARRGAR